MHTNRHVSLLTFPHVNIHVQHRYTHLYQETLGKELSRLLLVLGEYQVSAVQARLPRGPDLEGEGQVSSALLCPAVRDETFWQTDPST